MVTKSSTAIVVSLIMGLCFAHQSSSNAGVIQQSVREIDLMEPDAIIIRNRIIFQSGSDVQSNGKSMFEYVVASDYIDTLMDVEAIDASTKYSVPIEIADGPLALEQSFAGYNSTDFIWFRIDISEIADGDMVALEVTEYHKRRREAFPEKLTLVDAQTIRFQDSRYLLSPYTVQTQTTLYVVPPGDIETFTDTDLAKRVERGVRYGPYKFIQPFSFDLISVLFRFSSPQLICTESSKSIHVSHWGFLAVDEYFALENIGAKLKGEFSRVDFHDKGNGKNCMQEITAKYPWYIQDLYFHDFIGNVSSSQAIRQEENVKVQFWPRFPVCGGWKVDWNMGYKMPTKYNLKREDTGAKDDLYSLEVPFLYAYDVLLTEDYTFDVILPYGAYDINFEAPFEVDSSSIEKSTLTLDFFGTPKLVIKKTNAFAVLHNRPIKITYRFDQTYMLIKPIGLSLTVFAFYLAAIIYSRISLSFNETGDEKKTTKIE